MTLGGFCSFLQKHLFCSARSLKILLFFSHYRMSHNAKRMTVYKINRKSAYADLSFQSEYIQLFYLKSELQLILVFFT